jgi:hypothetical protein
LGLNPHRQFSKEPNDSQRELFGAPLQIVFFLHHGKLRKVRRKKEGEASSFIVYTPAPPSASFLLPFSFLLLTSNFPSPFFILPSPF